MEYTRLGTTDLQVSRLAFGTWSFGGEWGPVDIEIGRAAVRRALELGINFFDTAQGYGFGASERMLGEALLPQLSGHRGDVVLATKGGLRRDGGGLVRDASPTWLQAGLEASLRALGTDYIDLYQLHWPDPATPMDETARALESFVRAGTVRYIGVSNFDLAQMDEFSRTRKIDSLQAPYHLFRRDIERTVLPYCEAHGIGVMVYGPLAHGLLTGTMSPDTTFPAGDWRANSDVFHGESFRHNLDVVSQLKRMAEQRGWTEAQLAVAWTLTNAAVDVAIVGARRPSHIEQTAAVAEIHLTPSDLVEIDTITSHAVPVGGPSPEGMPSGTEAS